MFYLFIRKLLNTSILLLLVIGCQKNSEVAFSQNAVTIIPTDVAIEEAEVVSWKVGPYRKQEVSKGIRLKIKFPLLDRADMKEIVDKRVVDSWLVQVKRKKLLGTEVVGRLYIPLLIPTPKSSSRFRVKQMKEGFVNIYYAAAAMSTRFANFICPAFDHRYVITDMELRPSLQEVETIRASAMEEKRVLGKVEKFEYAPLPLNGGMSLLGDYVIEMALYHSPSKTRRSNLITLPNVITISREKIQALRGCENFTIPEKEPDVDVLKKFRFGR